MTGPATAAVQAGPGRKDSSCLDHRFSSVGNPLALTLLGLRGIGAKRAKLRTQSVWKISGNTSTRPRARAPGEVPASRRSAPTSALSPGRRPSRPGPLRNRRRRTRSRRTGSCHLGRSCSSGCSAPDLSDDARPLRRVQALVLFDPVGAHVDALAESPHRERHRAAPTAPARVAAAATSAAMARHSSPSGKRKRASDSGRISAL